MDGNGRWAQKQGLARNEGHRAGVRNVENIVNACRDLNVPFLTLYAFSAENWNRPRLEVEALMHLLEQFSKKTTRQPPRKWNPAPSPRAARRNAGPRSQAARTNAR